MVVIVLLCAFFATEEVNAVINNVHSATSSGSDSLKSENSHGNSKSRLADSITASSEPDADRREAPVTLSDTYGVPPLDSYIPLTNSNIDLPVPVYGIPNSPANDIVYPAPPPDFPPPLPSLSPALGTYGPPNPVFGSGGLHSFEGLSIIHKTPFGKPLFPPSFTSLKLPKPSFGSAASIFAQKPQYGPPHKIRHGPVKLPKPFGPPFKLNHVGKPHFGPPKPIYGSSTINGHLGPHKPLLGYPLTAPVFIPQKDVHGPVGLQGPPKVTFGTSFVQYGPPDPVPHGPPHPGVPAPPTPPDIKYDGWQPIPGLVSRPSSDTYGVPQTDVATGIDLHFNNDFVPPPFGGNLDSNVFLTYASAFAHGRPSDSYGAPLNSVTGSGGIVSTSINDHGSSHIFGSSFGGEDLSVIKGIDYKLISGGHDGIGGLVDSYSAPPADSYALDGPYPAAKPHKGKGVFFGGHDHGHGITSSTIGLLPPSGIYGVPPGGKYGAPLLKPPKNIIIPGNTYGPPVPFKINPPKSPVLFREPVPPGLIESIGDSVAHKDAHGIELSTTNFQGTAYIPPPIPDLTKSKDHIDISAPTTLYSLPSTDNPVSFQSVSHGSSSGDHGADIGHSFESSLTSYTAPLGSIDSTYGAPLKSAGLTAPQNVDYSSNFGSLVNSFSVPVSFHSNVPHDCSQHKSQPLPQISYGVPIASPSYSTALSSLNANIGGVSNYQLPSVTYGTPDLQTSYSLSSTDIKRDNFDDIQGKAIKELQKSPDVQLNNGLHNIPVQGTLASYRLQIQSAGGNTQTGGVDDVSHDQVLSEGLLQSILSAIEQPQQQNQGYYAQQPTVYGFQGSKVNQGYLDQHPSAGGLVAINSGSVDGEAQHSVTREVVVTAPIIETSSTTDHVTQMTTPQVVDHSLDPIDNNEVALYFNTNGVDEDSNNKKPVSIEEDNKEDKQEVRNGQQYGSFVSFRTPHSSYVYEDLNPQNSTQVIVLTSKTSQ